MSDYIPQPWLSPTQDGIQRPVSTNINVVYPLDTSASDNAVLSDLAGQIMNANASAVDRFVANNRQQLSLNGQGYADKSMFMDGMNVRHRFNQGLETLDFNVNPAYSVLGQEGTSDTNLDGYICWVHVEPNYPNKINNQPNIVGPFRMLLNGYIVADNYQPVLNLTHAGGFPVLFGRTALLAQSYVGDVENANPLLNSGDYKPPLKIIPPNGWGVSKDGLGPDGFTDQPEIPLTLGYWIFDWFNARNPFQYINTNPSLFGVPQFHTWLTAFAPIPVNIGKPIFDKGIYFPTATKSPLLPLGQNKLAVISPPGPLGTNAPVQQYDLFFGEFYDRGRYRIAKQSWKVAVRPNRGVKINDYPRLWAGATLQSTYATLIDTGALFDLSTARTKIGPTGDDSLIGPHDGPYLQQPPSGQLPADQQAQIDAWTAEVNVLVNQFNSTYAARVAAAYAALQALAPAYLIAHELAFVARSYAGDWSLYSTQFPGDQAAYTATGNASDPVVYPLAGGPVTGQFDQPVGTTLTFYAAIPTNQALSYYEDNSHNGTLLTAPSLGAYDAGAPGNGDMIYPGPPDTSGFAYYTTITSEADFLDKARAYILPAVNAYTAALANYETVLNTTSPTLPDFPDVGKPLGAFNYSDIAIEGDDWIYTQ